MDFGRRGQFIFVQVPKVGLFQAKIQNPKSKIALGHFPYCHNRQTERHHRNIATVRALRHLR